MMALATAAIQPPPVVIDDDQRWGYYIAFAKELVEESREAASDPWGNPEPWRDDRATDSQIKLIRYRRCGAGFHNRLPEPLYKAILYAVTGNTTSRAVKAKGQASDILNAFAYADEDVLSLWSGFERKVADGELQEEGTQAQSGRSDRHAGGEHERFKRVHKSGGGSHGATSRGVTEVGGVSEESELDRRRRIAAAFYAELGDDWGMA